jgi:hypothetical protein
MKTPKPICKAFTLPGSTGYDLVLSETTDRQEIEVSIQRRQQAVLRPEAQTIVLDKKEVATVRISGEQFELLCRLNSLYDGLQVDKLPLAEGQSEVVAAAARLLDEDRSEE